MSNQQHESELFTRLSKIEAQLQQLSQLSAPSEGVSQLKQKLEQLEERLEQALILLPDLSRYEKLRDLLAAGKWKEADQQTTKIMLEVAGKESQEEITPNLLKTFPCNAIVVIDRLWTKASNKRFGFSVQLQLYQSLGGSMKAIQQGDLKFLEQLGEQWGWVADLESHQLKDYEELEFSLSSPTGSMPMHWWHSPYGTKLANFFLARLMSCNL
ncbi:MAG: GUN4 domain-containing protein [Xenococcaceae cyanobacterium]